MDSEKIRTQLLEVFERNRKSPNTPFEESHFLDFLVSPPARKDNIKNSFTGVRRYYRFFEDIELTFAIGFSNSDQDRFYSVDQFVKKITQRIEKGKGNKMIVDHRLEEKTNYFAEIVLTLGLIIIIAFLKFHIVSIVALVCYGVAMRWVVGSRLRDRRHNKKLKNLLSDARE